MIDELEIDTTGIDSMILTADKRNDFLLQHGGIATRAGFETVEVMTFDEFKRTEVPKLPKDGDRCDDLYVLRDLQGNNLTLLYGSQVIKYGGASFTDVPLDTISKYLRTDNRTEAVSDVARPVVAQIMKDNTYTITVALNDFKFRYVENLGFFKKGECPVVYMPPIWLAITMTSAKVVTECKLAIVPLKMKNVKETKLYCWPLPNVFDDCRVCLGRTEFARGTSAETVGEVVELTIAQIFNSIWNKDLIYNTHLNEESLMAAYETAAGKEKYDKIIDSYKNDREVAQLLRYLCVIEEPNGWRKITYRENSHVTFFNFTGVSRNVSNSIF